MNTAILIQKVREQVGALDERSVQLLTTAIKIMQDDIAKKTPPAPEDRFVSRNITMEEYRALSRPERRHYQDNAAELNRKWIDSQLKRLSADWIMVIDGQVINYGVTLDNYPEDEEIDALQQQTGKCPFVFFNSRIFDIEEQATIWHKTNKPNEDYPAVAIAIANNNTSMAVEADLDTGAIECYCDLRLLIANGIIKEQALDTEVHFVSVAS